MTTAAFHDVKAAAGKLFSARPIEDHPLFVALREERLSDAQIRGVALQIYHVVDTFPRFLAALTTNISDWRLRMPIVDNLFEEHGRMSPAAVHVETYKRFLGALGASPSDIAASKPGIGALAYTRALIDLCLHHPYPEGLGALGVIEEIVARVSPIVAKFTRRKEGGNKSDLVHFSDHEVLDVAHADELYELAAQAHEAGHAEAVQRGLALGMYYHRRLYTDLLEEVTQG
jgi:pyrroloquinoline quinone (PQQ) biosynthesis protein C